MNERLSDICIAAGINTWPFNEVGFISVEEHELEKFAELIVRECADVAYITYWYNHEFVRGIHIKDAILENFGVE